MAWVKGTGIFAGVCGWGPYSTGMELVLRGHLRGLGRKEEIQSDKTVENDYRQEELELGEWEEADRGGADEDADADADDDDDDESEAGSVPRHY